MTVSVVELHFRGIQQDMMRANAVQLQFCEMIFFYVDNRSKNLSYVESVLSEYAKYYLNADPARIYHNYRC